MPSSSLPRVSKLWKKYPKRNVLCFCVCSLQSTRPVDLFISDVLIYERSANFKSETPQYQPEHCQKGKSSFHSDHVLISGV